MPKPTKEERLAHDTMRREESPKYLPGIHVPERMPGNAGYVRPKDRVYPEHEQIREWMMDLVAGNIEGSEESMHMREILNDVISDLHVFRNALATPEQYHEKGLL